MLGWVFCLLSCWFEDSQLVFGGFSRALFLLVGPFWVMVILSDSSHKGYLSLISGFARVT